GVGPVTSPWNDRLDPATSAGREAQADVRPMRRWTLQSKPGIRKNRYQPEFPCSCVEVPAQLVEELRWALRTKMGIPSPCFLERCARFSLRPVVTTCDVGGGAAFAKKTVVEEREQIRHALI